MWCLSLVLLAKVLLAFEPRFYEILDVQSSFIEFHWTTLFYDVRYKVWYWPGNRTFELKTFHTYAPYAVLDGLVPGQLYNIWLMGVQHADVTSDYIAFQQMTGNY